MSDHPYVAVTDADGKFRIDNLPAGDHTFRVWHERCGYVTTGEFERELTVTVQPDETLDVPTFRVSAETFAK